jgi:hypothetical protein
LCPEAANTRIHGGTYGAWTEESLDADYVAHIDEGSYGVNRWVYNRTENRDDANYWKGNNHRGLSNIPLFQDCSWYGAGPLHIDFPPEYEGQTASTTGHWRGDNMRRVCLNRHSSATNIVFLDITVRKIGLTVRKIGLKEMWTLKWHSNYITTNVWTKAGGVRVEDWPPWMRSFEEY